MADTLEFELVTPEKLVSSQPVEMVVVPGGEGDLGILPGHAPLISTVRPGTVEIYEGDKVIERLFVRGGFLEVSETRCTLLAETAQPVGDIKMDEAEAELAEAQQAVKDAKDEEGEAAANNRVAAVEALIAAAKAHHH